MYLKTIIVLIAFLLVGCSKSEESTSRYEGPSGVPIVIGAGNDVKSSKEEFGEGDVFRVWGTMINCVDGVVKGDEYYSVFGDYADVTCTAGEWTYSPPRYWIGNYRYYFCGIWPGGDQSCMTSAGINSTTFSIEGFDSTKGVDLLFANNTVDSEQNIVPDPVQMDFRHLLSQIQIRGQIDMSTYEQNQLEPLSVTVTISGISLSGDFSYDFLTDSSVWENLTTSGSVSKSVDAKPTPSDNDILYAIPQGGDIKISINYDITIDGILYEDRGTSKTFSSTEWLANNRYIYTFSITEGYIHFGEPKVEDWQESTGMTYIPA